MEVKLIQDDQIRPIYFGAPLTQLVAEKRELFETSPAFLIVSNQTTYDAYYEKLQMLLGKQRTQYWYVCPNRIAEGELDEFQQLLAYAIEMELDQEVCVVAFGDAGVIQVSGFFASVYFGGVSLLELPTSLSSLGQALSSFSALSYADFRSIVRVIKPTKGVFLGSRFLQEQTLAEARLGFAHWICLAMALDEVFYNHLKRQFQRAEDFKKHSLIPYVSSYLKLLQLSYQKEQAFVSRFGKELFVVFATIPIEDSLIKESMLVLSLGFSLFISIEKGFLAMDLQNWFAWLADLGYSLEIPDEWLIANLVEKLAKQQSSIICLTETGELMDVPMALSEWLFYMESYLEKYVK